MNKILFTIWILNVFNKKSLRGNFSFLLCILTQDYAVNKSVFLLFLDLLQLHGKCRLRINEQWRNEIRKWCHLFVVLETNVGSGDVIYGFHCPLLIRRQFLYIEAHLQGVPRNHGNSVTNSISSLLWTSIVISNFKSHNIVMSARVYLMKTVNGCL